MAMRFWRKIDKKDSSGDGKKKAGRTRWRRRLVLCCLGLLLTIYLLGLLLNLGSGNISGTNVASPVMSVNPENLRLLFDITGVDEEGSRVTEQEIFDTLLEMIEEAEEQIILDMFLVNRFRGPEDDEFYRDVTQELVEALVETKQRNPEIFILFITDPINSLYQTSCPPDLLPLKEAGGHVILTDLRQLPDSNFVYSPFYRVISYFNFVLAPVMDLSFLPNPFEEHGESFSPRQLSRLLNFKANHRKVAAVRRADGSWRALISSGNPHSASSAHGNVAVELAREGPIQEIVFSEYNLARASLLRRPELYFGPDAAIRLVRQLEGKMRDWPGETPAYEGEDKVLVQYLSEEKVARRLVRLLISAEEGDKIQIMMFYLSDPGVISELKEAVHRGASVRLLLDPNKDAFGREKHGVPNRVTAARLYNWATEKEERDLHLRWFDTHGEQAHFKALRKFNEDKGTENLMVGSSNFTIRNLRDQNLESVLYLRNARQKGEQFGEVFDRLWDNQGELHYTVGYEKYQAEGMRLSFKGAMKFIGNTTGLCTY